MSVRLIRTVAVATLGLALAACSEQAPTTQLDTEFEASAAELDRQAARATGAGDTESGDAFRGAADALRHHVRPTDIEVTVDGETNTYAAIVAATVETPAEGDSVLRRTLIAWRRGTDRPIALLRVSTMGNDGSFSSESAPSGDPLGRAHGTWVDFVRDSRWMATTGEASIGVGATGENCFENARENAAIRCVHADFRININGLFSLHGARPEGDLPAVRIQTEAAHVNGYIKGGGRGGRGDRPDTAGRRPTGGR